MKLHPRCSRLLAEVPAHAALIESVTITRSGGPSPLTECKAASPGSRTVVIEMPYTSASDEKVMTVSYATKPEATTSEIRWTDPLPPAPLRLGVRSLQFTWHRPPSCLAERWKQATPAAERAKWSRSCPRTTLADFTSCDLISDEPSDDRELDACEYRCKVDDNLDALALPIAVRFDRVRRNPSTAQSEIIYSWNDHVGFSGQQLTSVVTPVDRKVMLEFDDPSAWLGQEGDQLDAIRVVSGQSADQLDLTRDDGKEGPSSWVSLSTPGRTCTDRVRLAIFGTRKYDEKTFEVKHGHIELTQPYDYRPRLRGYALLGAGVIYRNFPKDGTPLADLGLGAQYDLGGPSSINLELAGQVAQTFYQGIELPGRPSSNLISVPYLRFDLRTEFERWLSRRFGIAMGFGGGLGTPMRFSDSHIVGTIRLSAVLEAQPIVLTMLPRRVWFIMGVGARLFEEHIDYKTDFTGTPTPDLDHHAQGYAFLRFRGALE